MVAVVGRLAMQILIAIAVAQRGHIHHPEMIREGSDQVDRLLEAVLDLEAQAVKINDVGSAQGKIGGHQQARAPGRVNDGDEADKSSGRTPDQITDAITQHDIALAVDWTGQFEHRLRIRQQGLELYLLAIASWAPPLSLAFWRFGWRISDSVGFDPAHQMMTLGDEAVNDLAGGVVGVGDKVNGGRDGDETRRGEHFVEQSAAVVDWTRPDRHGCVLREARRRSCAPRGRGRWPPARNAP